MPELVKNQSEAAKTILFVEDDPISLALYQDALENEGFHLECAQDGLAAFKILSSFVPDLVLLDLILPRFSGVHVIKYMQADPRLATVPVVILSNAALTEIVPPDSPLSPVVQGTRRLLKGDCNFQTLLRTIRESLAAPRPVFSPAMQLHAANCNTADAAEDLTGTTTATRTNQASAEARAMDAVILASSLKATLKEKDAKLAQLEEELAKLRKAQEDTHGKVKADQQQSATKSQQETRELQKRVRESNAELEILKAGLKHQTSEWARLESELREQLDAAKAAAGETEGVAKEKEARCGQLEQEIAALRKVREEFQGKLAAEHQTVAKAQAEAKELQDRLTLSKADLDRAKTTLEQQLAERRRLESEWREQLKAAKLGVGETEAILKDKVEWCDELEKEFAALQDTAEKSQLEVKQLQDRLVQNSKELDQTKSAAEQQSAERKHLETDWRKQLDAARATAGQTDAVLKEKVAWCDELEKELAAMQQSATKSQKEVKELQDRLAHAGKELDNAKITREQQLIERSRLEADWRKQFDAAKAAAAQTETALKQKEARCSQLEKDFVALQQVRDELQGKVKAGQQATEKSQKEFKEVQDRLSKVQVELDRAKAVLDQQAAERKRLEAEWQERINAAKAAATQQAVEKAGQEIKELQERLMQTRAELKRVKTGMEEQLEQLTRLETENRALVETKRTLSLGMTRMRETQMSREAELAERQKKLVDALREGATLLQARLQEASNGGPAKYEMPPVPSEPPPAPTPKLSTKA